MNDFLKFITYPLKVVVTFVLRFALALLGAIFLLYLGAHYFQVSNYITRTDIPPRITSFIVFSESTPPLKLFGKLFDNISFAWFWDLFEKDGMRLPEIDPEGKERLVINTNRDGNVGAVYTNSKGGGIVMFTREKDGREILDRLVARSKDGDRADIILNDKGFPQTMETQGYIYHYSNFRLDSVDVSVTDPEGNTSEPETVPINMNKKVSLGPRIQLIKPANAQKKIILKKLVEELFEYQGVLLGSSVVDNIDFNDELDFDFWKDVLSTSVDIVGCALGLATMAAPNPASAALIIWGCGDYIMESIIPSYTPFDPCNTRDPFDDFCTAEMIKHVKGIKNDAPVDRIRLTGQTKAYDQEGKNLRELKGARLVFTHRNGEKVSTTTDIYGMYGESLGFPGVMLRVGRYNATASAKGYITRNFGVVVQDKRVKINEGSKTVFDKKKTLGNNWPLENKFPP